MIPFEDSKSSGVRLIRVAVGKAAKGATHSGRLAIKIIIGSAETTSSRKVRRCGDGHPPVTKREREIRLNGISGVTFWKTRIDFSIRVFP